MFLSRSIRTAAVGAALLTSALACDTRTKEQVEKSSIMMAPEIAAEFRKRVEEYAKLSSKLAATLPKLSKDATPQQIDQDQRAFEKLVVQARAGAKQGDLFIPEMQAYVRTLLIDVFKGPVGAAERKAVHDEPLPVRAVINKRYPDAVALSTMPPRLLANLPELPDELEYRFVYNDLILMDVHAHIILDFIEDAMPPARAPAPKPGQ
jgi:hypothetical protein